MSLRYCCFYHPFDKPGFQGQKNLSIHVDRVLSEIFSDQYQTVTVPSFANFPPIHHILRTLHNLLWWRITDIVRPDRAGNSCDVTVVDMLHSVVVLKRCHRRDRLVLIGHDSYSLRAWRQLRQTGANRAFIRTATSWLCWRYAEFLARRLFDFQYYVSPFDCRIAGGAGNSGVLPIPLTEQIRNAAGQPRRPSGHRGQKLLVPVAVVNPTQNSFDMLAVKTIRRIYPVETEITLWGGGAEALRPGLEAIENLQFVTWVEDYTGFLGQFDAAIYPRIVGSGFHTKLAEIIALGIPSLSVDWIAEALTSAGYGGLSTFSGPDDFETAVRGFRELEPKSGSTALAGLPRSSDAKHALQPLVECCVQLLSAVPGTRHRSQKE